ncbi:MAG: flagellar type III secretion system protein FliR [Rhodospirillales bacterium]|nr:flagellar type III secretion system protein FliR [Rhodospirillales bacterium]
MLAELAAVDVFRFLLVFTRIGAAVMLFPGIGGTMVTARARLTLALAVSFVVLPVVASTLPAMPRSPFALGLLLLSETAIGVFMGVMVQMLMAALNVAGSYIGYKAGLTNAFVSDPVTADQSTLIPRFLSNLAVVLIFATGLHELLFRAVVDSYALFVPGGPLPFGDMSESVARALATSFRIGLQLAAPVMVFGLVFYGGMGVLARLMPQMPVFFVALPIQVLLGLSILMVSLPLIMLWFLRHVEDGLMPFVRGL